MVWLLQLKSAAKVLTHSVSIDQIVFIFLQRTFCPVMAGRELQGGLQIRMNHALSRFDTDRWKHRADVAPACERVAALNIVRRVHPRVATILVAADQLLVRCLYQG